MQSVASPSASTRFEIIRAVDPEFVSFLDTTWPWSESAADLHHALTINPIVSAPGVLSGVMICVEGLPARFQLHVDLQQQQLRVLRRRRCLHRPRRLYPDLWRCVTNFLERHGALPTRPAACDIVA